MYCWAGTPRKSSELSIQLRSELLLEGRTTQNPKYMDCKLIFRPTYVYVTSRDKGMLLCKAGCEGFDGASLCTVQDTTSSLRWTDWGRLWITSTKITRNMAKIRTITSLWNLLWGTTLQVGWGAEFFYVGNNSSEVNIYQWIPGRRIIQHIVLTRSGDLRIFFTASAADDGYLVKCNGK
jgi:hypothetical protein